MNAPQPAGRAPYAKPGAAKRKYARKAAAAAPAETGMVAAEEAAAAKSAAKRAAAEGRAAAMAKRPRGRPRIDSEAVHFRIPRTVLDAVDAWIVDHNARHGEKVTRPAALRRLIAEALADMGYLKE